MNADQFFKIARRVKWHVVPDGDDKGTVRAVHAKSEKFPVNAGKVCPLAYVTKRVIGEEAWGSRDNPSLPPTVFQERVIFAADGRKGRTWLLRGLGVIEA